jgi:hypothetical protein
MKLDFLKSREENWEEYWKIVQKIQKKKKKEHEPSEKPKDCPKDYIWHGDMGVWGPPPVPEPCKWGFDPNVTDEEYKAAHERALNDWS